MWESFAGGESISVHYYSWTELSFIRHSLQGSCTKQDRAILVALLSGHLAWVILGYVRSVPSGPSAGAYGPVIKEWGRPASRGCPDRHKFWGSNHSVPYSQDRPLKTKGFT